MNSLFEGVRWSTSPYSKWTIRYELRRNGADMQYRFFWNVWMEYSTGWYGYGMALKLYIDGVEKTITIKGYDETKGWNKSGTTEWFTVSKKTSGGTSFSAKLYDTSQGRVIATSSAFNLTVTPCGATITSAPDFNDTESPIVEYSNPASETISSLSVRLISGEDVITRTPEKNSTECRFVFTEEELNLLWGNTGGITSEVYFEVVSIVEGDSIVSASDKKIFTITDAPPDYDETRLTYKDTNALSFGVTGDETKIVQTLSSLEIGWLEAIPKKGATMDRYEISLSTGVSHSSPTSGTKNLGKVNTIGDKTLTVTAYDSRGFFTKVEKLIPIEPYEEPSVFPHPSYGQVICRRCDENGNVVSSGEFLRVAFKGLWSAISNNSNNPTIRVQVTSSSSNNVVTLTPTIIEGDATNGYRSYATVDEVVEGISVNMREAYIGTIICEDEFLRKAVISFRIPTAETTFHLREGGKGVGVGRYADTEENIFAINDEWCIRFRGETEGTILGLGRVREIIPNRADLNDYVEPGEYLCGVDDSIAINAPSENGMVRPGRLRVYDALWFTRHDFKYRTQEYYPYD